MNDDGIFTDLEGLTLPKSLGKISISYADKEVSLGMVLQPKDTNTAPQFKFDFEKDKKYTLIMTDVSDYLLFALTF